MTSLPYNTLKNFHVCVLSTFTFYMHYHQILKLLPFSFYLPNSKYLSCARICFSFISFCLKVVYFDRACFLYFFFVHFHLFSFIYEVQSFLIKTILFIPLFFTLLYCFSIVVITCAFSTSGAIALSPVVKKQNT